MKPKNQDTIISNLLVQICKVRRNKSNALLSETGIHSGQDILLYHLSLEDGQTVSSLVEKMCIQQATISSMIDRMVATGMITKEKDAQDKRTSRIYITDKGKATYKQVAKIWRSMESIAIQGLSEQQQTQLTELLKHVLNNLE
ncbi:MarR family winged helix-turn-helix transcriptional regulator [Chitinophaga filiformis]|uniref:MarR family winged helix-turn-helix transcriptional regulator n=1 Tax=Chitinophaga filiformis TaxID=104663 RepID=UPI001F1FF77A|nr:MarR family winged helix-turn-helix transcriptional regulator [Chitinophaga filiformis]MCF6405135.1 MarR family winged helix-turn-helix transcriptional regulator [Chitinophaga filiformis]